MPALHFDIRPESPDPADRDRLLAVLDADNARVTGGSTGTAGTSGTATTGAAGASMNNKFLLMGGNQQDLEQYLNSEVEIRGTLQKQSASNRTGATGTGTGSMASGQSKTHENVPSIRVTSVKQTAKTCTSGN